MRPACAIAILLTGGTLLHGAAPKQRRQAVVAIPLASTSGSVGPITAQPASISFTAFDPDQGSVAGSTAATVFWRIQNGKAARNWQITVQAGAPNFQGCGAVPVSAVTVSCQSVTASGGSGACLAPGPLSTSPRPLAGGQEDSKAQNQNLSVSIRFQFADSWRYVAATNPPCTLTLTYTVAAE